MNKKLVCVLVLCCLLGISAFADMGHPHGHHHHHHHHPENVEKKFPNLAKMVKTKKPDFAHPDLEHMRQLKEQIKADLKDEKKQIQAPHKRIRDVNMRTTLLPGVDYQKTVNWVEFYSIPFSEGDNIAVQVVRAYDSYDSRDDSPVLRLCRFSSKDCDTDKKNKTLSFEVSSESLSKIMKKTGSYYFSLSTQSSSFSGVSVGFYVCVGKNASLATCKSPSNRTCVNGAPSKLANVCVCKKGYSGLTCAESANPAPEWNFDSNFDEFEIVFDFISLVVSLVSSIIFFIIIIVVIYVCCAVLRQCCCRRRNQRTGRVVGRNTASVAPPPYPAGAYHPLSVVPPPPPPQMPAYDNKSIEMTTMPAATNANPVYIMPPLAPVRQVPVVPVFVQPPAPKN